MTIDERIAKHIGTLVIENSRLAVMLEAANQTIANLEKAMGGAGRNGVEGITAVDTPNNGHQG